MEGEDCIYVFRNLCAHVCVTLKIIKEKEAMDVREGKVRDWRVERERRHDVVDIVVSKIAKALNQIYQPYAWL